jgi:CxxC motif-containing protein
MTTQTTTNTPPVDDDAHTSHYLCIGCPMGCRLEVDENEAHEIVEVRGFSCKRGEAYAKQEHVEPKRMVTTTVAVTDGLWARLPVRTTAPVPKDRVAELCQQLHQLTISAPIERGEVVLANALGTEADVIASRSMPGAAQT